MNFCVLSIKRCFKPIDLLERETHCYANSGNFMRYTLREVGCGQLGGYKGGGQRLNRATSDERPTAPGGIGLGKQITRIIKGAFSQSVPLFPLQETVLLNTTHFLMLGFFGIIWASLKLKKDRI